MKISVRTTHYTNDNSPQLRGYAVETLISGVAKIA